MPANDNPYTPPQTLTTDVLRLPPQLTLSRMIALLGVGFVGGAALGALTSCINGALCPQFFRDDMDSSGADIWTSAVGLGALEGAEFGLAYAVVFIGLIAVISCRRCRFETAMRYAGLTFAFAFAFWLLGGATAVGFVWQFPSLCDYRYFGYDLSWSYAWVLGSVWGVRLGGLFSVLITTAICAGKGTL